jgi:hypothetical protein
MVHRGDNVQLNITVTCDVLSTALLMYEAALCPILEV